MFISDDVPSLMFFKCNRYIIVIYADNFKNQANVIRSVDFYIQIFDILNKKFEYKNVNLSIFEILNF